MARIRYRQFDKGLWVAEAQDHIPEGGFATYRGVRQGPGDVLKSRWGSRLVSNIEAHSLYEFDGRRFASDATSLYRAGAAISTAYDGTRLAFVRMQPSSTSFDYLFIAGGGTIFAAAGVSGSGANTPWCDQTNDKLYLASGQFTTTLKDSEAVGSIDLIPAGICFDGTNSPWTGNADDKLYLTSGQFVSTIKTSQSVSAVNAIPNGISWDGTNTPWSGRSGTAKQYLTSGQFTSTIKTSQAAVDIRDISFDGSNTPWCDQTLGSQLKLTSGQFTATIKTSLSINHINTLPEGVSYDGANTPWCGTAGGVGKLYLQSGQFSTTLKTSLVVTATSATPEAIDTNAVNQRINLAQVLPAQQAKIDTAGNLTRWGIASPSGNDIPAPAVVGVAGNLNGAYTYRMTYRNSTSGSRSNAGPASGSVSPVNQQVDVVIATGDLSDDPQADQIELWRTVGGGSLYFLLTRLTDAAQTYRDNIADADLGEELPTDNNPPESVFEDAVGPHAGRMWWGRINSNGRRGRVIFSPAGRPESMVGGSLDLSEDDDPIQKLVQLAGNLYAFTEKTIYQIIGTDLPFFSRAMAGSPGTISPFTVAATPFGICYLAQDGPRLFDGAQSRLIGHPQLMRLFRGERVGPFEAFEPDVGGYARGEYFLSDGERTFALDLANAVWREIGRGFDAFYYEYDNDVLQATLVTPNLARVVELEAEGVYSDDGDLIRFEVEPGHLSVDGTQQAFLQTVYFDINTNNQEVRPTLLLDGLPLDLPTFFTSTRASVRIPVARPARFLSVRLSGLLDSEVTLYGIETDVRPPVPPE